MALTGYERDSLDQYKVKIKFRHIIIVKINSNNYK